MSENIIQGIHRQCKRIREEVIPVYEKIPTGVFAIYMMRQSMALAEEAIALGDTLGMIAAYKELEGYSI